MVEVPSSGSTSAQYMIVGEAPGESEVREGAPFVGQSGKELDRMLEEAGLSRANAWVANVCRVRPPSNKIDSFIYEKKTKIPEGFIPHLGKHVHPCILDGIKKLELEINTIQPKVIIACGATAVWALCGLKGIEKYRGSILKSSTGHDVVPTYHPAGILRNWSWRAPAIHDLRKAKEFLEPPKAKIAERFLLRPTFYDVIRCLDNLEARCQQGPTHISVDIETRAHTHIACVGLAWSNKDAICIPLMCVETPSGYWPENLEHVINVRLHRLLTHPNCFVSGQNFLYDSQYFTTTLGIRPNLKWDTMGAQHTLFPGTPKDLNYLSSIWCDHHVYWKDEGKEWDLKTGEEMLWRYNCKDACATFEITEAQMGAIERANLHEQNDFQTGPLWNSVLRMMLRGVRTDDDQKQLLSAQLWQAIERTQARIEFILGHPFNPKSPKQMQVLFYEDFAQTPVRHPKTKELTCDDNALETIAKRTPLLRPLINLIADLRSLTVFRSTFIEAKKSVDGRMRCSFNPYGTYTFRFSSSKDAFGSGMNLQNVPTEGSKSMNKALKRGSSDLFPDVRKLFIPDPGYYFWNLDLDRADLQVVVWEADDAELKQMLREGVDLHRENAKVLFGLQSVADVTKSQREFAKAFVHATNYGASAGTVATATGTILQAAAVAQQRWFGAHPGIKEWHRRTEDKLNSTRIISNKFGYRYVFFDRVEGLLPEALAWIPQSTVACATNRILVNIDEHLSSQRVEVLLQVHDSVGGQAPLAFPVEKIREQCNVVIPYDDPLIIPVSLKTSPVSWGACA